MGFNENEEHLYHFTTFEAAVKILATNELRFSKTNNANDILESNRLIFFNLKAFENKDFDSENIYNEVMKYRQISLTHDDFKCIPHKYGFCINPMWGHYADSGNGVCIVLNKEKLLTKLSKHNYFFDKIEYVDNYDNTLNINSNNNSCIIENVKEFIANNWHETFFKKTTDWQYEQEFRIVKRANSANNGNLDIKGCIDCVIINRAKDISHMIPYLNQVNILRCQKFIIKNIFMNMVYHLTDIRLFLDMIGKISFGLRMVMDGRLTLLQNN